MRKKNFAKYFIYIFFLFTIVLPLGKLFLSIAETSITDVIGNELFKQSLSNSIVVSLVSSVLSISLALLLSYLISCSKIRFKYIFTIILTIPMLIPSISHGMGLVILFGENGLINKMFNLNINIYGFGGIVIGSILYSFPIAFLMLKDVFSYENKEVYVAADILSIPKKSQVFKIWFPFFIAPLVSVFFATFTLIFTDYGVPMMVGGRYSTLPIYMYNEVIGQANFGVGSIVGIVLLIPAVIASISDIAIKNQSNITFVETEYNYKNKKILNIFSYTTCIIVSILVAIPILSFTVISFIRKFPSDLSMTFYNIIQSIDMGLFKFLTNSLIISIIVAVLGTLIGFSVAYYTARTEYKDKKIVHLLSLLSLAIPGLVLGISYSMFFSSSFLSGTIFLIIIVNFVHFFSSPYLLAYNSMSKINKNFEMTADTLAIPRFNLIKDIIVPQCKGSIVEMMSYLFVNSMITISAVSFIANVDNMPLSMLITQFESQSLIECAAFVSLVILFVNIVIKLIVYITRRGGIKLNVNKKSV